MQNEQKLQQVLDILVGSDPARPRASSSSVSKDIIEYLRTGVMPTAPSGIKSVLRIRMTQVQVKFENTPIINSVIDRAASSIVGLPMDVEPIERDGSIVVDETANCVDKCTQIRVSAAEVVDYLAMKYPEGRNYGLMQLVCNGTLAYHVLVWICDRGNVSFIDAYTKTVSGTLEYKFSNTIGSFGEYVYITDMTRVHRAIACDVSDGDCSDESSDKSSDDVSSGDVSDDERSDDSDCNKSSNNNSHTKSHHKKCFHNHRLYDCRICNPCSHGKHKYSCIICHGCIHGKVRRNCLDCRQCKHKVLRKDCSICVQYTKRSGQPRLPILGKKVREECAHAKYKYKCKICNRCEHDNNRYICIHCHPCKHGNIGVCAICGRCKHLRTKQNCQLCSRCEHEVTKSNCAICNACEHGEHRNRCGICHQCEHGASKFKCKQCKRCEHGDYKYACRVCMLCEHGGHKYRCKICTYYRKRAREDTNTNTNNTAVKKIKIKIEQ